MARRMFRWSLRALAGLAVVLVAAAAVVQVAGGRHLHRTWEVPLEPVTVPNDSASVAEGARLAHVEGCRACHGDDVTGGYAFVDDWLTGRIVAPNLTLVAPEYSDAELVRLLRHGVRRDGTSAVVMPADMFVHLSDGDLLRIVAWLRSLPPAGEHHPKRRIGILSRFGLMTGKYSTSAELVDPDAAPPARRPDAQDRLALGRYLALSACSECHGQDLAGGKEPFPSPNLAIVAAYSPEQFLHFVRTGETLDGRRTAFMSMMCDLRFQYLSDEEIAALQTYLHTLAASPPVAAE